MVLIGACNSEPEKNIEVINPEAYAFYLDDGWEVNADAIAKDFMQEEINDQFKSSLKYEVSLITPDGDTLYSVYKGVVDTTLAERTLRLPIESQFGLDSTHVIGKYGVLFNVEDLMTGKTSVGKAEFELSMN